MEKIFNERDKHGHLTLNSIIAIIIVSILTPLVLFLLGALIMHI